MLLAPHLTFLDNLYGLLRVIIPINACVDAGERSLPKHVPKIIQRCYWVLIAENLDLYLLNLGGSPIFPFCPRIDLWGHDFVSLDLSLRLLGLAENLGKLSRISLVLVKGYILCIVLGLDRNKIHRAGGRFVLY